MAFIFLFTLFLLPLIHLRFAEAGCCCCCCPSCCCKPIIIKLPPPPVKLCPCCCNCCCCPCCCCGGGGGRKRRSVVDLMAKKFSDVLLPQLNQDALMPMGTGCGGQPTIAALAPLHTLCSQIPPAQRGPACQQITSQPFPLSQNIFNQQPTGGMLGPNGGEFGGGDCQCGNCQAGSCNCQGGNCANCAGANAGLGAQHNGCPGATGGVSLCPGSQMPSNGVFHANNGGDVDGGAAPFNFAQNFGSSSPCGNSAGGRKKRALLLLRKLVNEPTGIAASSDGQRSNETDEKKAASKRDTKNQNQSLVFRNNLEFVVRQSPQNL